MTQTAKLSNGSEEFKPLVVATMVSLNRLMKSLPGALAAYDLVELCKNSEHKMDEKEQAFLQDLALLQPDGTPHGSIRNIVLSAAKGEKLEMYFGSPLPENPGVPE